MEKEEVMEILESVHPKTRAKIRIDDYNSFDVPAEFAILVIDALMSYFEDIIVLVYEGEKMTK